MILQYQDKIDENNGNLTDIMVQIRTRDVNDFYKWLDIINCWYSIKKSQDDMRKMMEELNGTV